MKQLIIIVLLVLQGSFLFAQQEKRYIKKGNDLYEQKNYREAEENYRKSVMKAGKTLEGNFNLGDALYKQKKFDEAGQQFSKIAAASAGNRMVAAQAFHNLGNSLLEKKKYEESIVAYKKSLLNNPKDEQTRYNLSYAQNMLKKQQNKDNKNDKNKNDKNKDKDKKNQDDKNKDKDKKDQDKKDQDKKDQDKDKKDQDKKNQDNKDNKNNQDQQQQQPQPNSVSKDDAERMLEALNNDEKATQDKLKNKKLKGARVKIEKDW